MSDVKVISPSQLNYSKVENKQVSSESFKNSQNVFNLFDKDGSGVLEESEINNFFSSIDSKDGKQDNQLTTKGLNAFMDSSSLNNPQSAKEFVDFTNELYKLTQEMEADIDLYSSLNGAGGNTPNGKIDSAFKQSSQIGDCWLLTQSYSLSETPWGADMIYDAIKQNDKGDYLVTLKGVDEDIQISKSEFDNATNYAKGEPDLVLIEMAVEKYINNHQNDNEDVKKKIGLAQEFAAKNNPYHVLSNNNTTGKISVQYLFGGKTGERIKLAKSSQPLTSNADSSASADSSSNLQNVSTPELKKALTEKAQNPAGSALVCGLDIPADKAAQYKARGLEAFHAYSLSSRMDGDKLMVILTNPHNSANRIEVSYDEFTQIVGQASVTK